MTNRWLKTVWNQLTDEQLMGAEHSLRVLRTSPSIRGHVEDVFQDLQEEIWEELFRRGRWKRKEQKP